MHESDHSMVPALSLLLRTTILPARQDRITRFQQVIGGFFCYAHTPSIPPCSSPSIPSPPDLKESKPPPKPSLNCSTIAPLTPTPPFSITLVPRSSSSIVMPPICPNLRPGAVRAATIISAVFPWIRPSLKVTILAKLR
jgi:hypothetical protein